LIVLNTEVNIMTYNYTPRGVCSRGISVELDDNNIIKDCRFIGGCMGNTTGICALVKGMSADEAIEKLSGIDCGGRGTSCPDQLSIALRQAVERN
jgi:uncharacterized protein (TIGR03905 family)